MGQSQRNAAPRGHRRRSRHAALRSVPCRHCGAKPGEACRDKDNTVRPAHRSRWKAAKERYHENKLIVSVERDRAAVRYRETAAQTQQELRAQFLARELTRQQARATARPPELPQR